MINENCLEYQILLNEKVDGAIKDEDDNNLSLHLEKCDDCNSYYNDLITMKSAFKGIEQIKVSKNFEENLFKKIQTSKSKDSYDINENREVIKKTSLFTKFVSYAAGVAIVAIAFVALEKSNLLDKENKKNILNPFNSNANSSRSVIATTNDSSKTNNLSDDETEETTLDSLEKLKNKPYIDIDDMKHRVSNEEK